MFVSFALLASILLDLFHDGSGASDVKKDVEGEEAGWKSSAGICRLGRSELPLLSRTAVSHSSASLDVPPEH